MLVLMMYVCINALAQWRRKMISSGVAKKTMRPEIAVSSEQHNIISY